MKLAALIAPKPASGGWASKPVPFPPAVLLAFAAMVLLGLAIRRDMWLIWGGLDPDYIKWAYSHYFGGIAISYVDVASKIASGRWGEIGTAYPPGYSFLLAAEKLAGIDSIQHARLLQAALDALAAVPIYYLLVRIGTAVSVALVAALAYVLVPWWAMNSTFIMAESLLPAFVACVLAMMAWVYGRTHVRAWFAVGLLAAFVPLCRPEMILLVIPLAIWAFFTVARQWRWRCLAGVIVGFGVPLFLWASFNWYFHHEFLLTTSAQYYALWSGLGQFPNEFGYFVSDDRAAKLLQSLGMQFHTAAAEDYFRSEYLKALHDHPDYVVHTVLARIRMILFTTDYTSPPFRTLGWFYRIGPHLTVAAVLVLLWRRRFAAAFLVAGPVLYCIFSLGLVYVEPRYVRYASLSYLLAVAVLGDTALLIVTHRLAPSNASRIRAFACLAVVVIAAPWLWREWRKLDRLADDAVLAYVGPNKIAAPARPDIELPQLDFHHATTGVESTVLPSGALQVVSSSSRYAYQLSGDVPLDDAAAIRIDYHVEVQDGGVSIGILSEDGSQFLAQAPLGEGVSEGHFLAGVDGKKVHIVISNNRQEDGHSTFVIRRLAVTRLCSKTVADLDLVDDVLHPDRAYGLTLCSPSPEAVAVPMSVSSG